MRKNIKINNEDYKSILGKINLESYNNAGTGMCADPCKTLNNDSHGDNMVGPGMGACAGCVNLKIDSKDENKIVTRNEE